MRASTKGIAEAVQLATETRRTPQRAASLKRALWRTVVENQLLKCAAAAHQALQRKAEAKRALQREAATKRARLRKAGANQALKCAAAATWALPYSAETSLALQCAEMLAIQRKAGLPPATRAMTWLALERPMADIGERSAPT